MAVSGQTGWAKIELATRGRSWPLSARPCRAGRVEDAATQPGVFRHQGVGNERARHGNDNADDDLREPVAHAAHDADVTRLNLDAQGFRFRKQVELVGVDADRLTAVRTGVDPSLEARKLLA